MPVPNDVASPAQQLFLRAQTAWRARAMPRYESFILPCASTFLEAQCTTGADVQFILRLLDGRVYAQTVGTPSGTPVTLLRGGYITGPAGDPATYPLRDLWIARSNDEVVRLTYALPYKRSTALIAYEFAPVGDIAFPTNEPDSYFESP